MSPLSASAQLINATNKTTDEARKFYDQGHTLLRLEKFNDAIGLFDKPLGINPKNTDVLNDKQKALNALGREVIIKKQTNVRIGNGNQSTSAAR